MEIKLGKRVIGDGKSVFIIAELSANHNGSLDCALETVRAMKKAGADAVKIQTYTPDTITLNVDNKFFHINQGTLWDGKSLYELYKQAMTPWEWHAPIQCLALKLGLEFFSTPFDRTAVDFLETLNVPAYKIASFEITDVPLIEYVASKGKPILISTGIASLEEINDAFAVFRSENNPQIALLKCTSSYPAPIEEANLRTIPDIARRFGCVVGLSDHTLSAQVPVAAVALGAEIIEKHFILDRRLGGPDSEFSLEPAEFKEMVRAVRETEKALGRVSYDLSKKMKKNRYFARSLFISKDVRKGDIVTEENIRSVRPSAGLPPKNQKEIMGRKFNADYKAGTPLALGQLE